MITFFILAVIVVLFRHSCRTNNKWRYRPQCLGYIDSSVMKPLPQQGSQSILYLADVCEWGCDLCFLVRCWELGSSVLSVASPSFCIPYAPSPTRALPGLFAPLLFSLSHIFKFSLSNGFILSEHKYTQEFSIFCPICPPSFHGELLEWISFILFFTSSPHICYCSHDNVWSCY